MRNFNEENKIYSEIELLCNAIEEGNLQRVKEVLQKGVDLEQKNRYLFTPLQYAVGSGHLEIVRNLLQAGASVYNQAQWLLERANGEDRVEILLELIKAGIDVNQRILDDGQTVLMYAAGRGDICAVKALVEAGANVNLVCDCGSFALVRAADGGHQEIFNYLYFLTSPDLREEAKYALDKGLIIRQRLSDKLTENFIKSAAIGDLNTAIQALKNGVDINAFGSDENTALYLAAYWGHLSLVRLLIEAGANLELGRESDKETPLIAASGNALLLKNTDSFSKIQQVETVKLLIQYGTNVNAKTTEGWNALSAAANAGAIEIVKVLLSVGADVNLKDIWGETALNRALKAGHQKIVQLLKNAGAKED